MAFSKNMTNSLTLNRKLLNSYFIVINLVLLTTLAIGSSAYADSNKIPNIVLMVADDHGREAFGAYGNKVIRTPHLDQLAKEGVMFDHAYATTASCSASRSVLLTGLHNHKNGQYGHQHSYHHFRTFSNIKSLPVRLTAAGYQTARVGKYHIGPEEVYRFNEVLEPKPNPKQKKGERNSIGMAMAAEELINSDKPFFLYLATNDPHRDRKVNVHGDNTFGNEADDKGIGTLRLDYNPEKVEIPPYMPDIDEARRETAELYQSISRVDDTMGELVRLLKKAKKYDNTIIIYLSDNGTAMPGAKTTIYDPGVRLPLVVKTPKNKFKGTVQAMVSWDDITPTILDLANVSYDPSDFHGKSFRATLNGSEPRGFDEIYGSHQFHEITMYFPMRMVRTKQYKLIWNIAHGLGYPFATDLFASSTWQGSINRNLDTYGSRPLHAYLKRPRYELFDMQNDPNESTNLAYHPKYSAIRDQLIEKIKVFQQQTDDPWFMKWEHE